MIKEPAGAFVVGHGQKFPQLNIMIAGKVAVFNDGETKILEAPLVYTGTAGRKIGYVIEDTVWQNVYATDETDVDKLEAYYLDKSAASIDFHELKKKTEEHLIEQDRADFHAALAELGVSAETVKAQ